MLSEGEAVAHRRHFPVIAVPVLGPGDDAANSFASCTAGRLFNPTTKIDD